MVPVDYSFKLCEMSLHVVSVGLLQNVAKKKNKKMHTHMVPFRIIGCLQMLSKNERIKRITHATKDRIGILLINM